MRLETVAAGLARGTGRRRARALVIDDDGQRNLAYDMGISVVRLKKIIKIT